MKIKTENWQSKAEWHAEDADGCGYMFVSIIEQKSCPRGRLVQIQLLAGGDDYRISHAINEVHLEPKELIKLRDFIDNNLENLT